MGKEVELDKAQYIVFIDFFPDPFMRGYANYEDAKAELDRESQENDTSCVHYLVKVVERETHKDS